MPHLVKQQPSVCTPTAVAERVCTGKWGEFLEDHQRGILVAVPFPTQTRATATFWDRMPRVKVEPAAFVKTRVLIEALRTRVGCGGLKIAIKRAPPIGYGLGSSTLTMYAGALAVYDLLRIKPDLEWLGRAMANIEPTDALCTEGQIVVWDFERGQPLSRRYRLPHGTYIGAYLVGRQVITEKIAKARPRYAASERRSLRDCFDRIHSILEMEDLRGLCQISCRSADINQIYFPKPEHGVLRSLKNRGIILGYFVAHSGSAFGVIAGARQGRAAFEHLKRELTSGYEILGFTMDEKTRRLPFGRLGTPRFEYSRTW
jgi:uncharacterized protein involved in propanediol utilization